MRHCSAQQSGPRASRGRPEVHAEPRQPPRSSCSTREHPPFGAVVVLCESCPNHCPRTRPRCRRPSHVDTQPRLHNTRHRFLGQHSGSLFTLTLAEHTLTLYSACVSGAYERQGKRCVSATTQRGRCGSATGSTPGTPTHHKHVPIVLWRCP